MEGTSRVPQSARSVGPRPTEPAYPRLQAERAALELLAQDACLSVRLTPAGAGWQVRPVYETPEAAVGERR